MSGKDFRNVNLSEIIEKLQVGMSFTVNFDGKLIEALCLDISDEGKTVMLFPEMKKTFSKRGNNSWRDSSLRKKLNSDDFFRKFDEDFINHTVVKEIHTCDYITHDRFWLLSHEEVGCNVNFFKENHLCQKLKYFDGSIESRRFGEMFCSPCDWWLRSAGSGGRVCVGFVSSYGNVFNYSVDYNDFGVFPVCLIC